MGEERPTSGMPPREMAEWIVRTWREVRGSDRMLTVAITEALSVIPSVVAGLERENDACRAQLTAAQADNAPLLDAVRGLVECVEGALSTLTYDSKVRPRRAFVPKGMGGAFSRWIEGTREALAAVRAVLSRAQDTAGISRGGDG